MPGEVRRVFSQKGGERRLDVAHRDPAQNRQQRLASENQSPKVVQGVTLENGIEVNEMLAHRAA